MIKCSLSIIRLSSFCGDGRAKIKNGIKKYAMSGQNPRHNVNDLSQNYTKSRFLSRHKKIPPLARRQEAVSCYDADLLLDRIATNISVVRLAVM